MLKRAIILMMLAKGAFAAHVIDVVGDGLKRAIMAKKKQVRFGGALDRGENASRPSAVPKHEILIHRSHINF